MAQPQQNISITAPGYWGLNLEDSPVDLPQQYATVADNAVIDRLGRLGARLGFRELTPETLPAGDYITQSIGRFVDGNITRYVAGIEVDGTPKLFEITNPGLNDPTLTELTLPAGYTLPTANVQILDFAGRGIIIVPGAEMLVISSGLVAKASDQAGWIPPTDTTPAVTTFSPTCGTAAFGRLWVSGVEGDEETIYYSDVLNPGKWIDLGVTPIDSLNTAGALYVGENWPLGKDRIVGINAHNNNLIVFGRSSILVWGNPQGDPAAIGGIFLSDTIKNIGLVNRDAVVSDGRDLLFVDDTGLRSLGRTIQEQSAALGDLTRGVRTAFTADLRRTLQLGGVELVYSPKHSMVLMICRTGDVTWVADTRIMLEDGSYRITRWPSSRLSTGIYLEESERLLLATDTDSNTGVLLAYEGLVDYTGVPFVFQYRSPMMSFGDPTRLKIVKQVDYTVVSGQESVPAKGTVGYIGYRNKELNTDFQLLGSTAVNYSRVNPPQYNSGVKYGLGDTVIRSYRYNAGASGENVLVGFTVPMLNNSCSLAQINVQTKLGRIV